MVGVTGVVWKLSDWLAAVDAPVGRAEVFTLTRAFPALSNWHGDILPLVRVVGVVLNWHPVKSELAGDAAFWPAASMMAPALPRRSTLPMMADPAVIWAKMGLPEALAVFPCSRLT